jgi:hypothetical protein
MTFEGISQEKKISTVFVLAIVIVAMLVGIYVFLAVIAKSEEDFAPSKYNRRRYPWKLGDRVGDLRPAMKRCVRENPQGCESFDKNEVASKCLPGFRPVGKLQCHQIEGPGLGLGLGLGLNAPPSYVRQSYSWRFGDRIGSLDPAMKRCVKENPQGCETLNTNVLAKCRPGYKKGILNTCVKL